MKKLLLLALVSFSAWSASPPQPVSAFFDSATHDLVFNKSTPAIKTPTTLDFFAGSYKGLQLNKATGNWSNAAFGGGDASLSPTYPIIVSRDQAQETAIAVVNVEGSASATPQFKLIGDTGAVSSADISLWPNSQTLACYANRMSVHSAGASAGISLVSAGAAGSDVRVYTNGGAAAQERLRIRDAGLLVQNGAVISARNFTDTADLPLVQTDASNWVFFGNPSASFLATTPTTINLVSNNGAGNMNLQASNIVMLGNPGPSAFSMADTGNANVLTFSAPSAFAASGYSLVWPVAQGAANSVLLNNGSGTLSWLTAASANTASTLVQRDSSGNFTAGTITANLTGNASGSSGSTTGNAATATALAADPADCASNTYASSINASGTLGCASITNAATTATASAGNSTIVARDGSGNFAAGTITAALTGNVTGNVTGSSGSTTGNAATVTTNANLTGPVTSVGNATSVTNLAITNAMIAATTIDLTAKVTGVLPLANGGTNTSTSFTTGSIPFSASGTYTQDNSDFFWDNSGKVLRLGAGTQNFATGLIVRNTAKAPVADGNAIVTISSTDTSTAAGIGGSIELGGNINGANTLNGYVYLVGFKENGTPNNSDAYFAVHTRGSGAQPERMRISSTGALRLDNYSTGVLVSDSSGNITSSTSITATASGNLTATPSNHGMLISSGTNAVTVLAPDASTTKVWTSGGSSADPSWQAGGTGTVTSVAATVPTFLSISGSPVTTTGTLAITLSGTALPIANGGTAVTSVTSAPTASAWAGWDANLNASANNFIPGYATTATGAGTTTLVVGSASEQYFTGSTTQTVVLPVTSTLVLGQKFHISNQSTGVVTVQSSGANAIVPMGSLTDAYLTVISTSGTGVASWALDYRCPQDAWVAWTPTIVGAGTAANVSFRSRRNCSMLEIMFEFSVGSPSSSTASFTLGYNGTNSNVTGVSWVAANTNQLVGRWASNLNNSSLGMGTSLIIAASGTVLNWGYEDATHNSLTAQAGNSIWTSSNKVSGLAAVPIANW